MASLSAVRDGLANRLRTISGLRVYDTVPDKPEPPAAVVAPAPGTFVTFDTSTGSDDLFFRIILAVSKSVDRSGQDALDAYLAGAGASSVRGVIDADPTLGGVAHWVQVTGAQGYGVVEWNGVPFYGCEVMVTVGVA